MRLERDLAVWLYGSHARGDADEFSDIDILVVSEGEEDEAVIGQFLRAPVKPSVSWYTWSEIDQMAQYGSLFLRHIELEGRPIFESLPARGRLEHLLSSLGPYRLARRDIEGFRTVLSDVRESLDTHEASLLFELSTLGTVFRHASVLGCSLAERPCFSRIEPVARLVAQWKLGQTWANDFPSLYVFRMYADKRIAHVPVPSIDLAYLWCRRTHALLDELRRRTNDSN